jgi:hypothetical protein
LDERTERLSLVTAERFADGEATLEELRKATVAAWKEGGERLRSSFVASLLDPRAGSAHDFVQNVGGLAAAFVFSRFKRPSEKVLSSLYQLLHDLIGNPFRPPPRLDASVLAWNDAAVPRVAAAIYEERRFEDLPILADALEEAGCTDAELLGHCRGGEHARGCWAVDSVLRRS